MTAAMLPSTQDIQLVIEEEIARADGRVVDCLRNEKVTATKSGKNGLIW